MTSPTRWIRRTLLALVVAAPGAALVGGTPARAHPSAGIVMDRGGNVFYSDLERVWRLRPDGSKQVVVKGVHTHELWVDAAGNVYGEHLWYEGEATDRWGYYVWRLAPDGTVSRVVPAREGFRSDWSFVRDAAGNGYWAQRGKDGDVQIRRKDARGAVVTVARGRFGDLRWMAAAPAGTVFFTALADGVHDLYRVAPDGRVVRLAHGLTRRKPLDLVVSPRHATFGLWADRRGGAYVTLVDQRQVVHVDAAGKVEVVLRLRLPWAPTGGLLATDGSLWVLEGGEPGHTRVRHLARDGTQRVFE